ncbi:MAG TPA: ATP phosphoribosyltransferase regulatory subunit [Solirubrobacteraceae bacterium]|nr:ATP phosphoribosyltransferase regulatory subunit [Solirubrobacteraceae bacterium]
MTIHPTPSGTRDVLPDEMRELHAVTETLRGVFDVHGYGEVHTPALEYEQVLTRGDPAAADPAYKLFDEQGNVLVLRSDMTIPIARVVSTRYAHAAMPLRFCYVAHAYRSVRPQRGQDREMLQAGIELVGVPAPDGTAEAITVLCAALDAAGLESYRIGLGDASLYPALLTAHAVPEGARRQILHELVTRDFVGLEREVGGLRLGAEATAALTGVPQRRGGAEVLDSVGPAADPLRAVVERLAPGVAGRVIFDLGLARSLGYYTGAVFEVYDAALGAPLGGGGRYDDLLGRFGRDLPAVGWALNVERLHIALVGERGRGETLLEAPAPPGTGTPWA